MFHKSTGQVQEETLTIILACVMMIIHSTKYCLHIYKTTNGIDKLAGRAVCYDGGRCLPEAVGVHDHPSRCIHVSDRGTFFRYELFRSFHIRTVERRSYILVTSVYYASGDLGCGDFRSSVSSHP